jgi:hypothetical protein
MIEMQIAGDGIENAGRTSQWTARREGQINKQPLQGNL